MYAVDCGVSSVKCKVWTVRASSVKGKVNSVECKVLELRVWSAKCRSVIV